ncbi:Hypothetical predicted protein [Cloeon dipterum]|uniref:Uncharacterized protein n=1 Tax=Cloeon dipterum TaxID=197152 RepID=A0A8S1D0J8_9INSE|nr:Hypothetical predicted protein [Cloeon dipterum]
MLRILITFTTTTADGKWSSSRKEWVSPFFSVISKTKLLPICVIADLYRAKTKQGMSLMTKFPTDVVTAESLSGGNVNILKSPAFMPEEKVNYKELFESPKKKAKKSVEKQGTLKLAEKATTSPRTSAAMAKANHIIQIKQRITHPRFVKESDHEIRIRQQPVASNDAGEFQHAYKCQECTFGTNRQNLFILHCKSHRDQEKLGVKPSTSASTKSSSKSSAPKVRRSATPKASSTPKNAPAATKAASTDKPASKKTEKKEKMNPSKESAVLVRKIFQAPKKGKRGAPKKFPPKTEEEIAKEREKRNKILADWDEDEQEEEIEIKKLKLDTSGNETAAEEPTEMEQDEKEVQEEKEEEAEKNDEEVEMKEEAAPIVEEEEKKSDAEPKQPEKKEETTANNAASVYDIIEEPEAIAPPPSRESKEDLAKEKEKLSKDIDDLLKETAVPSLPELPSLPNIPMKKSETENVKEQKDLKEEEEEEKETAQSSPAEAKAAEPAKTNGATTATTEEAVTISPSEESADANTETATYVLVTVDEGGFHQLSGLDGMATTLYIDPSQLAGGGTSLDNLYLAIDDGSIAQLDQQQVALQVGAEMAKTTQQDILAAALANTQVLQTSAVEATTQEAVVKVTNTTQAPVMTPRVTESTTSAVAQSNGAAGNSAS